MTPLFRIGTRRANFAAANQVVTLTHVTNERVDFLQVWSVQFGSCAVNAALHARCLVESEEFVIVVGCNSDDAVNIHRAHTKYLYREFW